MSTLVIPPQLFKGDPPDRQYATELQQYYQRHLLPEILRFDIDTVAGNLHIAGGYVRVPFKPGIVSLVRTYSNSLGSGSFVVDIIMADLAGASVFAAASDRITMNTYALIEKPATAAVLTTDPRGSSFTRFYVEITNFSGTAWAGVTVEVVLDPISL